MRHLKLTKKTRPLALAVSALATVVCLSIGLNSNNHNTNNNQSRYQLEILLFCAGLSSAITFELLGQSLLNSSFRRTVGSNRFLQNKACNPDSHPILAISAQHSSKYSQRVSSRFLILGSCFLIGCIGILSIVSRGAWISAQKSRFYTANEVPPATILDPAQRLIKNLPTTETVKEVRFEQTQPFDDLASHLEAAKTAIAEEDYQTALESYKQVLDQDNQNLEALTQRCSILSRLERPTLTISACEELNLVSPNDVVALSGLGKANKDIGQYRVALDYYEQALSIAPDYRPAQQGKNEVYQVIGQPQ